MQTDTPHRTRTTSGDRARRAIHSALRAIDARWRDRPTDLEPGGEQERVLAPLLACAARVREPGAADHMRRVGRIAEATARAAGWTEAAAAELRLLGALHDLGKLGIRTTVLGKAGPLTDAERRHVERHAGIGHRLLSRARTPLIRAAARVALQHHEWWNGDGYPHGLAGREIAPAARIIAIADVYDALTSPRPYRGPLAQGVALRIMRDGRGTQFDPELFDAFVTSLGELPHGASCVPGV